MSSPLRTIFFGTSSFAARILRYLIAHGVDIRAVVTRPDRPKGRSQKLLPPPVKEMLQAVASELPTLQPDKASTETFCTVLKAYQPDLFLVAAYGEIVKQNLLALPRLGSINVHGSVLPEYRGAAPMQRALIDGVKTFGVTIMEMVLEMDAGDIFAIAETPVPSEMNCGELEERLAELACPLLLKVLKEFEQGTIKKTPQDSIRATFAPKITPSEEELRWELSAEALHNRIRAFAPQPGAWCRVQIGGEVKRLKIKRSEPLPDLGGLPEKLPGETLAYNKERWIVACGSGALSLLEVQLEGKKTLPIDRFVLGVPSIKIIP